MLIGSASNLWSQSNNQINNKVPIINADSSFNCYVYKNMEIPPFANGVIKYQLTFHIDNDTVAKLTKIDDYNNLNCNQCEKNLFDLLNNQKWPSELPKNLQLPGQVIYLLKINLIQNQKNCPNN